MRWYLATRPETVLSIVQVGRLPDVLPHYISSSTLRFFSNPFQSIKAAFSKITQTFLLEAELPRVEESSLLTLVSSTEGTLLEATQINLAWLRRLCVNSVSAHKLLVNLFNGQCPLPINIEPQLFSNPVSVVKMHSLFSRPALAERPAGMHYLIQGDLLGSRQQTLVNTVNCVGIMGKGIAYNFKLRYPEMFEDYKKKCTRHEVQLGMPYLYKYPSNRWILNFPTKQHWKNPSRLEDIEAGLQYLAAHIAEWGITSLAIPPLGCGNGGLQWDHVKPLIEQYLGNLNISVEIYVPFPSTKQPRAESKSGDDAGEKHPRTFV